MSLIDPIRRLRELNERGMFDEDPEFAGRLLDILHDTAVILVDDRGLVRYANLPTELMFGYRRIDLIGYPLAQLLPAEVRDRHTDHLRHFFADPRPRPMGAGLPLQGLHRNGSLMAIDVGLSSIVTRDGVYAAAVIRRLRTHDTPGVPAPLP